MATLSLDDPRFQPLTPEEEERRKKTKKITEDNKQDLVKAGTDETDIELSAEDNSEVSGLTSFVSGVVSGGIKIPEGVVSYNSRANGFRSWSIIRFTFYKRFIHQVQLQK